MSRPALCLLGPADGRVVTGPERVKLTTSAAVATPMFPEGNTQETKVVIYLKHTFEVDGVEFDFYIPEDASRADAFAALYNGYKPKETR